MDAQRFERIKAAFERNDGVTNQSDEAQRLLNYYGAKASALNAKTILLKPQPTNAEVFEEFIHTSQYRTGRATGANSIEMEIEAARKLLRFADRYKLTKEDTRQIQNRLNRLLNDILKKMFEFKVERVDYLPAANILCLTGKLLSGEIRNDSTAFFETEFGAKNINIETVAFVDSVNPLDSNVLTLTVKGNENLLGDLENTILRSTISEPAVSV